MFFYNLIPKWLLAILVVALIISSGILTVRMYYYKIDNAKLTQDLVIEKDNVKTLTNALTTCQNGLKAEADNAKRQQSITTQTQKDQKEINNICVQEKPGEKTNIQDAINKSNDLSNRFNKLQPPKNN